MNIADAARFQAMAFTAQADGLISSWDSKYHFNFWRPVTAILAGKIDGHSKTAPDHAWTPLIVTPPHPEYTAAHSHVTASVVTAMAGFYGKDEDDDFSFTIHHPVTNEIRRYDRAIDAIREVSDARVWGGIHYRFSVDDGMAAGQKVAHNLTEKFFKPLK